VGDPRAQNGPSPLIATRSITRMTRGPIPHSSGRVIPVTDITSIR
jgi:hypothetical protein